MRYRCFVTLLFLLFCRCAAGQTDINLYLGGHYLAGKSIIKLSRDFDDRYMWILAPNNEVYRFNTATHQLDDYTSQFNALKGYQIFDIAGINQNTAAIAIKNTDTTKVAEYVNGQFIYPFTPDFFAVKNIGRVTSVGAASDATDLAWGFSDYPAIFMATTVGLFHYSISSKNMIPFGGLPAYLYSATYRDQVFDNWGPFVVSGANLKYATSVLTGAGYYDDAFRTGPPFGDTINTAYVTTNALPLSQQFYTPDGFWGTIHGLFQEKFRNGDFVRSSYRQYLSNIKVNKITDIYGLTAFGNSVAKENLLVGTDKGLYYSSSFLHAGADTSLDNINLYHFDPLGNIPINFVEVSAVSTQNPICENEIYLATNNGFYIVQPDFTPYLDTAKQANAIQFDVPAADTVHKYICEGDSIKLKTDQDVAATAIQWFKNGKPLSDANGTSLTADSAGEYYAVLYDPCQGTHVTTNHLKVSVISSPVFSFNYPDTMQQCSDQPDTLKVDYNPGYHYRWYTNGQLNGDTSNTYVVTQSGKYKVEVSACSGSWVPSKEVEVDMVTLPVPQLSADKPQYCAEDTAKLSLNLPADTDYTINWYRNGNELPADKDSTAIRTTIAGNYSVTISSNIAPCEQRSTSVNIAFTPAPAFTFNYPDKLQYCSGTPLTLTAAGKSSYRYRWYSNDTLNKDTSASLKIIQSGKYKVEVSACPGSWVGSKQVQVNLVQLPVPVITTDKASYCLGDVAQLSVSVPPDPAYSINWYRNDTLLINNANSQTLTTTDPSGYTVQLTSNTPNTDGSICSQTSTVKNISFNPLPKVSIEKIVKTTLCDGQTVNLKADYTNGSVAWSTGETTDRISVATSGAYTATVTSPAGCITDTTVNVQFFPNPVLNLPDTSLCVFTKQMITLTAPPGFVAYSWNNGVSTGQTYTASIPETVTLTVTDTNGCQATQEIVIADQCPDVHIPNAFTPNGDGVNDTWNIAGLENDESTLVRVYSRYGQLVYQSRGYGMAWNGEENGKKLPAGVYYYIITAKNNKQKFSGSLTIIY